jgi:signal peptidase I
MEGRLFAISLWCGVYGFVLRQVFQREALVKRAWIVMILNSLFWATATAMGGMLIASYSDKMDQTFSFTFISALAGFAIGALLAYKKSKDAEDRDELLKDNLEWADTGFSAILLASVVMFFIVQAFKIPSGSMRMTFIEGDHLFVNKFIYGIRVPFSDKKLFPFRPIQRHDIVIFRYPTDDTDSPHYGKDFIKRVIALEGQTVLIKNKKVFVDGVEQDEPFRQNDDPSVYPAYFNMKTPEFQARWQSRSLANSAGNEIRDNFGPITVPAEHLFVMGDNRDHSFDSRFWGPLPMAAVKGKAWVLYLPIKRFRIIR